MARRAGTGLSGAQHLELLLIASSVATLAGVTAWNGGWPLWLVVPVAWVAARTTVPLAIVLKNWLDRRRLGWPARKVRAHQQVVDRYGDDPDPELREQAAKDLVGMGATMGQLGRSKEAIRTYQRVVDRYRDDPHPGVREQTARALGNMGTTLAELGQPQEAIAACQQVVDRYGDDPNPALRDYAATALYNMAMTLGDSGKAAEEIRVCQQVVDRYGKDPQMRQRPAVKSAAAVIRRLSARGLPPGHGRRDQPN